MEIPDYELADVFIPQELEGITFNKERFSELMHKHGITKEQAQGLWEDYTNDSIDSYQGALQQAAERQEQQEERDKLDRIEEKLTEADGYSLTPEEASALISKITNDKNHAYWNDEASVSERDEAIALVNRLYEIQAGKETSVKGYFTKHLADKREQMKDLHDGLDFNDHGRSSSYGKRESDNYYEPEPELEA